MPRAYTTEELRERYEKLPDALKDAIFSTEVAEKIFETGKKHGLTIEKIGFLAEETGRVILGLTRPQEFVPLLTERLGTATDAAQKVASDINHQIFFPLREILKSAHQMEVGEAIIQKAAPVDLRSVARPAAAAPLAAPTMPQGTVKVPPIDLRAAEVARDRRQDTSSAEPAGDGSAPSAGTRPTTAANSTSTETAAQPPLVDVGAQKAPGPASQPAAKAPAAPTPIFPPPVSPKIQPIDLRKPASPPSSPPYPQPSPTRIPQSSPQAVPLPILPGVESTIPSPLIPRPHVPPPSKAVIQATGHQKIDLRGEEIDLDFMPPPPTASRPAPPIQEKPKMTPPTPPTAPPPQAPALPPVSKSAEALPPTQPAPSKTPPIDLRREPQPAKPPTPLKTKPWSGSDPYREPIA